MKGKVIGYLLIAVVFFYGVTGIVSAPPTSLLLGGGGITIDLAFPEEAHPNSTITHNFTITAHAKLTLQAFNFSIYAPVNATWQEIGNPPIIVNLPFIENQTLTSQIEIQLPPDTDGTLRCEMTFQTDKTSDLLSSSFYTTHVSELTFDEMLLLYNEMLANHTLLQTNYTALMNDYNSLLANYSTLLANYTALLSEHNELLAEYSAQVASYQSLDSKYRALQSEVSSLSTSLNTKSSEYNSLQTNYGSLNSTFFSLQGNYTGLHGNYTVLEGFYNSLNEAKIRLDAEYSDLQSSLENSSTADRVVMFILVMIVAGLIGLIIYIRRRESEPYVIIRKETVALRPDNKS
jgi:hypothetical protein